MSTSVPSSVGPAIEYPDCDGEPMSDNTLQFDWIVTIKQGLAEMFVDRPDVFVAGDLLWYPVEGDPKTRVAPDAMVAFGRPPGYRGSYKQWEEGGIAPQVVFEVLSPGNRDVAMRAKLGFYDRYGVEEYYVYDPHTNDLSGWLRRGDRLERIESMSGWTSPRLGIRFELEGETLQLYKPDGSAFQTMEELFRDRDQQRQRAEAEHRRAEAESQRAEAERQRAEAERQRADFLAELLRAHGIDPNTR